MKPSMIPEERWLLDTLRPLGDGERAVWSKAYMKSALDFLGCSNADVHAAARTLCRERPFDRARLLAVVDALFASRCWEVRQAAVDVLDRQQKLLTPGDLPFVIALVRRGACWAFVDHLACHVAGGVLERHPERLGVLDRWATDDDFWVRRTALLAQERALKRGGGDFERFARLATPMLGEKEFFIRKAIGWVLRETSKKRPELVRRYLEANAGRMSGLTLREGLKHLPRAEQQALLSGRSAATTAAKGPGGASRRPAGRARRT
ncbi:MAG: DNA alkylation repair protein [Myxococcaceae bacterium]|nr:DNA alkylation repair protein [Myxococcaceae bacterium]